MTFSMVELGDPVLRNKALPVDDVFSIDTQSIIEGMIDVLLEKKGVGIAAPQVGIPKQIFIVSPEQIIQPPNDSIENGLIVINPTISLLNENETYEWEGCLSIPGLRGYIPRCCNIKIDYTNCHGELKSEIYTDFIARVFLHEYDHLQGVMFLDRIRDIKQHLITDQFYIKMMEEEADL